MKADKKAHKRRVFYRTIIAVICVVIFITTLSVAATDSYNVTIIDGEKVVTETTRRADPLKILEEAGFTVDEGATVVTDNFKPGEESVITISRLSEVELVYNEKVTKYTFVGTVGELLDLAGIIATENMSISSLPSAVVFDGMKIVVDDTFMATIKVDGKDVKIRTTATTVKELLKTAGVKMTKQCKTDIALDEMITETETISVTRKAVPKEEPKKVENTKKASASVKPVVKNTKNTTTKATQPKDIPAVTDKNVISQLKVPEKYEIVNNMPTSYKSIMVGKATAYANDPQTSTGRKPMPGIVAVDPREIPYGTEMWITSADGTIVYGYAIAGDTGGFIYTTDVAVDLFMMTTQECYDWGIRNVNIYFL